MGNKKKKKNKEFHPPGSLVYRGQTRHEQAGARIVHYGPDTFREEIYEGRPEQLSRGVDQVTWIHVNGIHNVKLIEAIGKEYRLHPLILEDILHTSTAPKLEDSEQNIFVSLNSIVLGDESDKFQISNVSLVLLEGVVLSFQESGIDFNQLLYQRIATMQGTIRSRKADYLFYRCMDIIVDEYSLILDSVEDRTEDLEDRSIGSTDNSISAEVQQLRKQLIRIRRNVTPLKNAVNQLYIEPGSLIDVHTMPFIRDLLDHLQYVHSRIEGVRENLLNIMDINFSNISNKTNEVMRVLTIVATLFIPLTFFAGIYGMNFHYMPELGWKYSYAVFWGVIVFLMGGMLLFFRKKKWL